MVTEEVVLGSVGQNCLTLLEDGQPVSLLGLTRARLDLGVTTVDSDEPTEQAAFDWDTFGATGKLVLTLGEVLDSKLGRPGLFTATLWVEGIINGVDYPAPGMAWVHRDAPGDEGLQFKLLETFGA